MVRNLPNLLTLARIFLVPFFVVTLIYNQYRYALIIFIAASVTDILDGFIARITNQITDFGKILDPVADKFFLVTSFILMSSIGLIPKWLAIIVISKDLIVVTGSVILYFVTHKLNIEPSILGKASSASQFFLVGLVLLYSNLGENISVPVLIYAIVAALTSLAGIHYVYKGLKIANIENP
ncbi:MAG TPA: CDP-diacylglycerol--glycerol-3-phosphate 3-phosphatidyltransferase [Nitrospiraceae bacterium]|nr:CDP-diacylglycerol--glycerol-3-phosphate 3-phosphatidyltransferase [Nitrospiraceae bacterium]